MDNLKTYAENTWCPGCGNFGIFTAITKAIPLLEEKGLKKENIVITAGIGCHAKIFDYLNLSGFYGLHGRNSSNSEGIKIANPDLKIINFSGDGNGLGEGLAHTLFAAKRNQDMTFVLHNNSVYALTTGQFSPLTEIGWKGPSTPMGSFEAPFNPISLLIEVGATFVARCYAGEINHLTETLVRAIEHEGFSFIEILQPAVSYHKWTEYSDNIGFLDKEPTTKEEALTIARNSHKFTLGVFYQGKREVYHKSLYGNLNPVKNSLSREKRLQKIEEILKP
ncbi:MAG: 2-oxoacid:ferredoxin oxidoreductase subunit beta [Candidatus Lokiarchaeota archaeon]|nr:2-oxoacid:ferredoxin oxidoreductase subunit beta [Candidatus Lokiarchaeota archaeon]